MEAVAFQTRARTVDHLGREQIADCPTAVSELWKNSFDAYATAVELNIYDGEFPVVSVVDDGHGMSREEFVSRWLVVGTETKTDGTETPAADRNGLVIRPKQGQKGIGRLSCANLGPLLLLISKRENKPFVAALLDWRLFENPYLNLSDIEIPVVEFAQRDDLFPLLPDLIKTLSINVLGDESERGLRLRTAWRTYDAAVRSQGGDPPRAPPTAQLSSSTDGVKIEERHLAQWPVWNGASTHGTALLILEPNYDLRIYLDDEAQDLSAVNAKRRFFETLSSFVDPFLESRREDPNRLQFTYQVRSWRGGLPLPIVGTDKQFDRHMIDPMEHRIEGEVSSSGVFTGRVKAFGEWLPDQCVIRPPKDLAIPVAGDTEVGPFSIYIAAMEFQASNSTHTRMEFERFRALAELYAGFMMFRDGLRVLPYGRTDNDFFEIESRRSKNAGREFWNHRQMFGRLGITRSRNPNLKDKAGREGLLDNRAAKTLKGLVSNILMQSARTYFGSASELREEILPQVQAANAQEKADKGREALRKRQRQAFKSSLASSLRALPLIMKEVGSVAVDALVKSPADIPEAQVIVEQIEGKFRAAAALDPPKDLGSLEDEYSEYQDLRKAAGASIRVLRQNVDAQIVSVASARPGEILRKQMERYSRSIEERLRHWHSQIETLQRAEHERIRTLVKQRTTTFSDEATPVVGRVEVGQIDLVEGSSLLDNLRARIDQENEGLFGPYIGALESLQESIDLQHLATFGMEELSEMRVELERLNSLAQLGIAVEIVGHELQAYDDLVAAALRALPTDLRNSKAIKDIEFGYEGLADQLRFLSPLRLSGQKIQRWIAGSEIADYVADFFKITLGTNNISFAATPAFREMRIYDQAARLFPVFINLINNSVYWLSLSERSRRQIQLTVEGTEVIVSDNGPGVDPGDVASLFSLFFTRKVHGGRGVGLYLSRANLAAGGHRIRYAQADDIMPLPGANFIIDFRGAEFGGG